MKNAKVFLASVILVLFLPHEFLRIILLGWIVASYAALMWADFRGRLVKDTGHTENAPQIESKCDFATKNSEKIADFILKYAGFPQREATLELGMTPAKVRDVGNKLEALGLLERGKDNRRVLAQDLTPEKLACLLSGRVMVREYQS